jgi:hypothetical protein
MELNEMTLKYATCGKVRGTQAPGSEFKTQYCQRKEGRKKGGREGKKEGERNRHRRRGGGERERNNERDRKKCI